MATLRENETLISQTEPNSEGIYTRVIARNLPDGKKERVTQHIQQFRMYRSKHAGWLDNELIPVPGSNAIAYRKVAMKKFGRGLEENTGVTVLDTKTYTFTLGEKEDIPTKPTILTGIKCRNCGGTDHLTFACKAARKDEPAKSIEKTEEKPTKYIPPAARKGFVEENRCLRISNLSYDCNEDELRMVLSEYGRIERLRMGYDPVENVCKGWAFVTYTMGKSATIALTTLNKARYGHTVLDVSWADNESKK